MYHAFLYISLPSLHDNHVKMPNFTFCEGRKQGMSDKTYFLIMNLDMADGNSVGIITIVTEKNVNSLFMRRFHGCQLSWHLKPPNIYEDVIDASVNTCCKLKLVFSEKRL